MRVLYIHNDYHKPSGEEHAANELYKLLESHGHEVRWFRKTTKGIEDNLGMKLKSFYQGVFRPSIRREIEPVLEDFRPSIVVVQNIYPFISSAIFKPIKDRKIPIVMRCPNYRLFCPGGLALSSKGEVCEKCWQGGKEWHCVLNNCEQSMPKSVGYALRNAFNRMTGMILKNVDCFVVQSEFQKKKFVGQGISSDHVGILPGILPEIDETEGTRPVGEWVSFVGRVSLEKGIEEFVDSARRLPNIQFKVAGYIDDNYTVPVDIPQNIEFVGFLAGKELDDLYLRSRIVVVPSKWYEGFPNVILHAMLLKRPVISTKIGAMESIIDSDVNGILVEPSNAEQLTDAIASLYPDMNLCEQIAVSGYQKARRSYSRERVYKDLMDIFEQAIENNKS